MKYKYGILLLLLLWLGNAQSQTTATDSMGRRKASKQEVKAIKHLTDSFLTELKKLYALEVSENSPRKYQPERIALVRSYLLLYQGLEKGCDIVSYTKSDVKLMFGSPDSITVINKIDNVVKWHYSAMQKNYVRINNLRYVFYFQQNELMAVKRE